MLDPIRKYFGYGQLWPACGQDQAELYMPDLTSHIWFSSALSKKAQIILCETGLGPVWMVWSDFGQTGPDHIVQNWPGSSPDGLVRFWPNTSALEVSQCARVTVTVWAKWLRPRNKLACKNRQACFWPTLPNRSRLDASQSSMFTGTVFCPL